MQVPDVVATGQPLGWEPHAKEAKEAGLWRCCGDSSSVLDSHPRDSFTRMGKETLNTYLKTCILFQVSQVL